jgi:hypothetical protein
MQPKAEKVNRKEQVSSGQDSFQNEKAGRLARIACRNLQVSGPAEVQPTEILRAITHKNNLLFAS